jgi:hypothetical protein
VIFATRRCQVVLGKRCVNAQFRIESGDFGSRAAIQWLWRRNDSGSKRSITFMRIQSERGLCLGPLTGDFLRRITIFRKAWRIAMSTYKRLIGVKFRAGNLRAAGGNRRSIKWDRRSIKWSGSRDPPTTSGEEGGAGRETHPQHGSAFDYSTRLWIGLPSSHVCGLASRPHTVADWPPVLTRLWIGLPSSHGCGLISRPRLWVDLPTTVVGWSPDHGCGLISRPRLWVGLPTTAVG